MATSTEALTRLQLKTIAGNVVGLSPANITLGIIDEPPTVEFWQGLTTYLSILMAEPEEYNSTDKLTHFVVPCRSYFWITPNSNQDGTAQEDIVSALRAAWGTFGNYTTTHAPPPQNIKVSKREV